MQLAQGKKRREMVSRNRFLFQNTKGSASKVYQLTAHSHTSHFGGLDVALLRLSTVRLLGLLGLLGVLDLGAVSLLGGLAELGLLGTARADVLDGQT
jgi:hypothetical protein